MFAPCQDLDSPWQADRASRYFNEPHLDPIWPTLGLAQCDELPWLPSQLSRHSKPPIQDAPHRMASVEAVSIALDSLLRPL